VTTDVLFFHGAGEGAFEADAKLAASLARELGDDFVVSIPELPEDDDADDNGWRQIMRETIGNATAPVVLVAHSAGGYVLVKHLATEPATTPIAAICLIAAPFPGGDANWTFDGFDLPEDFGRLLPTGARVLLYASEDDDIVPFAHRDLYAAAIPGAVTRTTSGGHQLGDDLEAVARDIRALPQSS
jgi:predicted alpha/beta hydrolase family esterase